MLKNYLILAWRNVVRNKLYASINILGLSIGISACLVITLIVRYEMSFDTFRSNGERIFRVYSEFSGDINGFNRGVPAAMADYLKTSVTGLESSAGFHSWSTDVYVQERNKQRKDFGRQEQIVVAGPEFFDVFTDFDWLAGNPSSSLTKPFQVVLTESKAKTYFGVSDARMAIGHEIHYRDSLIVTVSGIVADTKPHTDIKFSDFISLSTVGNSWLRNQFRLNDWSSTNGSSQLFIKLPVGTTEASLQTTLLKLSAIYKEHQANKNWKVAYHLQPLDDLHFNSKVGIFNNSGPGAHLPTLKLLGLIAFVLLAIASINFINLETAQSIRRAKEVGIRKVMGSTRKKLIVHFLLQSGLLTLFAVALSLPVSELALLSFREFIPSGVTLSFGDPFVSVFLAAATVLVGLMAGFYPAFSMSSFLPALALKNQIAVGNNATRTGFVRKGLIVFQFVFAQALIIAALVVSWQISYMMTKDLGFSKDAVLYFETPWQRPHVETELLKNELERIPEIKMVSLCSDAPASANYSSNSLVYNDGKQEQHHNVYRKFGDPSFIPVFDMKLLAGRNFHRSDSAEEVVINETYSKLLGFQKPDEALDKIVMEGTRKHTIVGVVRDFNFQSLRTAIEPAMIGDEESNFNCVVVKLTGGQTELKNVVSKLQDSWKKVYPDEKLEYFFLDESIARFYHTEQQTSRIVDTATIIAVVISCLGLFGLASFTAVQRTKEIGIRKVLGATVDSIVVLLSKEFLTLVLIAFILAAPVSWYFANSWVQRFAFRSPIGWEVFAWTALVSVVIALLSVSYQALRAARANPSNSLRTE